jgi:hypothetical protein
MKIKKTGRWYFKPKFFGGFDLYIEEKITYNSFYPHIQEEYRYRKGNLSDLCELGLHNDTMNIKIK